MGSFVLDFSGIRILVKNLPDRWEERAREEWAPFVAPVGGEPFLRFDVALVERTAEIEPFEPHLMKSAFGPAGARFEMSDGEARIDGTGAGRLRIFECPGLREYYVFMNLLRACLAWCLPDRGAAMLHAAGLVLEGRAYVLVGEANSGKSTWVALGERAGARAVSDDIVLVGGEGEAFEVLGSPLRSTHEADYRPGRWPLAAVLFPKQGTPASLSPCPALLARARITANLPFVADAIENDSRIGAIVDGLVQRVPCMELTFGLDTSFVDLLRSEPRS